MKNRGRSVLLVAAATLAAAAPAFSFVGDPVHVWSRSIPMPWGYVDDGAIAIGPNGNVTAVVATFDSDDFGSWNDSFVRQYGPDGSLLWSHQQNTANYLDVASDSEENVIVVGSTGYPGNTRVKVIKFDSAGNVAWTRSTANIGTAFAVRVTPDDGIVVAGKFGSQIDLGGGPLLGGTGGGFFIVQYDRDGTHQWSRSMTVSGRTSDWQAMEMSIDESGNVFIGGEFTGQFGPVDFGGGPLDSDGHEAFAVSYDGASGAHRYSKHFAGVTNAVGLDVDRNGNLVVYVRSSTPLNSGLIKLDSDGVTLWSKTIPAWSWKGDVACDPDGNVFVTGGFSGLFDFGGGPIQCDGYVDVFLVALDKDGTHQWSRRYGDPGFTWGCGLAVADGDVFMTGHFEGTVDFGGGPLTSVGSDIFLAGFAMNPVAVAISSFDAEIAGRVVALRAAFRSDLGAIAVKIYRAEDNGPLLLFDIARDLIDATTFDYVDRTVVPGHSYRYQIGVVDADGEFLSTEKMVSIASPVASLSQNQPNPFNPSTTIRFSLPTPQDATVSVYDASGGLVRTLIDAALDAGDHEATWDGRDERGAPMGSGVYFYQLRSGKTRESKKMILLK